MNDLVHRHFTSDAVSPYATTAWKTVRVAGIDAEAPQAWSETAIEIAATRYFRRRHAGPRASDSETSVRQLVHRVTRSVRLAGEWQNYFATPEQARVFEDELAYILLHQKGSFNSPVYFNLGMFPVYGFAGTGGNFVFDRLAGDVRPTASAYVHPQASACFIQDVGDDLMRIFDLLKSEAKLFKYGSGTGTNFSTLRAKGEPLDVGGESTGLISYLEVFDKAAQAIKSGGTTRRAAKMVVVDADHPEIVEFIRWKMVEERKARVLIAAGFSGGYEGEAFHTVSGQNSNNSVRVTDEFLSRALNKELWTLRARRDGQPVKDIPAAELLREMARAAWECADPGIQYHDTIQKWHLCPRAGEIRASNPCSEYMFIDNSACNLASLNLLAFLKPSGQHEDDAIDWPAFAQTARILLLAQDILVDYASYPTAEIARHSHQYRPLGLGYANLGALLMSLGLPYESDTAARWTGVVTAAMHAIALDTSQRLAAAFGPFGAWAENAPDALNVLEKHRQAARALGVAWIEESLAETLRRAGRTGLRNAQVTLIAPTGTIGLFMDCDTLGIEPEFTLLKRKHLVGGGELRLSNRCVGQALRRLGYSDAVAMEQYILSRGGAVGAPGLREEHIAVFDTALPPAGSPERRVSAAGHLKIMAAAQPFLSGAISKTINLPATATVEEIERIFVQGWRLGLKSLAVYRDGSKSMQPLCADC